MRRQNDRILKEELPRSVGAQYAAGDQWRNNSRKNEGIEPKQKQYPVVDGTGDRSKVQCWKEQYCIGSWNVRSMNQGKLEMVKQEMARVNVDILRISKLKWTGMGEFNSDDRYIYYCGQESFRRNWVAIIVNKRVRNAVLGCNLKNNRMISVCFQGKPFNVTVIQAYAPTSNAEEAEIEQFCEDLQDLELTPKKDVLFIIGDWNAKVGSQETPGVTGKFVLGVRNEAGQRLIEFCQENKLVIANTLFQQHKRRLRMDIIRWSTPKSDWLYYHLKPIKKQRHYITNKGPYSQNYGFSSSHVWMWELDHKEGWAPKNWCFQTVVLEKTLESSLDWKKIKAVNHKGNQSWIYIERADVEAEAPILWPPDAKSWLIGKDPDSGRLKAGGEGDNRGQDGWMASPTQWTWVWASSGRWLGQVSLACCSPWGCKELDMTEQLNKNT